MMLENFELYRSSQDWLPEYVRSSFGLSGLHGIPEQAHISAHRGFLMCRVITISNIEVLAAYVCPNARWREPVDFDDANSSDCDYPKTELQRSIEGLFRLTNAGAVSADELLLSFGRLRPLTFGNGRIGRALWMWRTAKGAGVEFDRLQSTRLAPASPSLHS